MGRQKMTTHSLCRSTVAHMKTTSPILPKTAEPILWTKNRKLFAGVLVSGWMFIVLMGPVTNPIATEELTAPVARALSPIHQGLFVGHGYRFFAPDPGPSHLLVYKIYRDGELVSTGHFPDRNRDWPRLIYHRWFMLSESIYSEHARTPDDESFASIQKDFQNRIEAFRKAGQGGYAANMQVILERQILMYAKTKKRIAELVDAVGKQLLVRYHGDRVELFLQERRLPAPVDLILGQKITDESFLSELLPISAAHPSGPEDLPIDADHFHQSIPKESGQ